ncbi:hypothetical protein ACOSP7_008652 [Xanthoceras sorbifolium]
MIVLSWIRGILFLGLGFFGGVSKGQSWGPSSSSLGVLIRDARGEVLLAGYQHVQSALNIELAEALAVKLGICP